MVRSALLAVALALLPASGAAQITPITVPKGQLRWDFSAQFESWDWRWRDGNREEAAADFARASLDPAFVPSLASAAASIRQLTGLAQINLSLGQSTASQIVNRGTRGLGGAFGLTRGLTIFGTVPIVSVKIESRFLIDAAQATAGVATTGANLAFLGQLGNIVSRLQDTLPRLTDPAQRTLVQRLIAQGGALQSLLAEPFLPMASSAAGAAVQQAVQAMQADLSGFNIALTGAPALATRPIDPTGFNAYLTDPTGIIRAAPLDETPYLIRMGDVEVGAALAILDRFPTSRFGSGVRSVLNATVRLRTAQLDRQDRFLDLGTGDRQPDLEVNFTTDVAAGRFGARLAAGYNLQLPGNQNRRVAPFDQPIAPDSTRAGVRRDPGDVLRLSAQPFFRIATHLSLFGGGAVWARQADRFEYAAGQPPIEGVDIGVLSLGSKSDAVLISGGVSYSHSGQNKRGLFGLPMDASLRYERIARSGTGVVPDLNSVRVDLRLYSRLWR
ncbi:MAG: hypothetical protein FJ206_04490 [Gemmatimonadetes bacterium]|nr:hypothetical protein [Gemmatimonadota bacterium]